MPEYKKFARGIHVSHYQRVDWSVVMPHVDFVIAKCSQGPYWKDPTFSSTVQACYDYDKPCLAFVYYEGTYYTSLQFDFNDKEKWIPASKDLQLQNMIETLKNKRIYGLAVDIEETRNKEVAPSWMSEGAKVFTGRAGDYMLATRPEKPVLVYTRQTYINEYAPNMNNWVHNYPNWVCQPKGYNLTTLSWEVLENVMPPDTYPVHPLGAAKDWKFWQWQIDRFILPGIYNDRNQPRTVCTELYNGTVPELHEWLGFIPGQNVKPPAPAGDKFVVADNLNVRTTPSLAGVWAGMLKTNDVIYITDIKESKEADGYVYVWGNHATGWSAIKRYKLNKEYMKRM